MKPNTTIPKEKEETTPCIFSVYNEKERKHFVWLTKKLEDMRHSLDTPMVEYDGRTYFQQYEQNKLLDLGYTYTGDIKDNDFSKASTGTVREKDTTILASLLELNLQPQVTPFDKTGAVVAQLGETTEDLVKKSREMELWEDSKRIEVYRELVAQGEVYVEDRFTEYMIPKRARDKDWKPTNPISKYKGGSAMLYDKHDKCETILHSGKYVLTSSMNEMEIQNNEMVAIYERVPIDVAESVWGKWDRWKYVKTSKKQIGALDELFNRSGHNIESWVTNGTNDWDAETEISGSDFSWDLYNEGDTQKSVSVVRIFERFTNRYMLIVNDVMMLPIDFALTNLYPSGFYPIAKGLGEVIPNFRSGKGSPSKTRIEAHIYDEFLRGMVNKARQGFYPSLGSRSRYQLPKDFIEPHKITTGIREDDIFTILPPEMIGLTNADITMYDRMREVINDKTLSDVFSGQGIEGGTTATEIVNKQKQTMQRLGAFIDGVRNLERQLVLLRIFNIYTNWTKSKTTQNAIAGLEQAIYAEYSVNTTVDDKDGRRIVRFHGDNDDIPTTTEQYHEEQYISDTQNQETRITYLNADYLRGLQFIFDVGVVATPESDSQMSFLMKIDNVMRIANLFGIESLQKGYWLKRFGVELGENPLRAFVLDDQEVMAGIQSEMGGQVRPQGQTAIENPALQKSGQSSGYGNISKLLAQTEK